jgi:hypothetical protein
MVRMGRGGRLRPREGVLDQPDDLGGSRRICLREKAERDDAGREQQVMPLLGTVFQRGRRRSGQLAAIESGAIAHAQTRAELLEAITTILDASSAAGDLRADISAEDIAASLLGILAVAGKPEQHTQADRLPNLLIDGLRPRPPSA